MIQVIATGSSGNCTAIKNGETIILLDAGIGYKKIQVAINFEIPLAALITHEHGDHAKKSTIAELMKRGVEVYMTAGTARALELGEHHRLNLIETEKLYKFEEIQFYAVTTVHDAASPCAFQVKIGEKIISYITDSGEIPKLKTPNFLLIETNYNAADLMKSTADAAQKKRIMQNHLSVEKVVKHLKQADLTNLKEIHLMHISKRHGDGAEFKKQVQAAVGEKVKVFAHWR